MASNELVVSLDNPPKTPVDKCERCKKVVTNAFIRCTVCDIVYHRSCATATNEKKQCFRFLSDNTMECIHHGGLSNSDSRQNASKTGRSEKNIYAEGSLIIDFVNSYKFSEILRVAIDVACAPLHSEIATLSNKLDTLTQEIQVLKSSNIDMIKVMTNDPNKGLINKSPWNCTTPVASSNFNVESERGHRPCNPSTSSKSHTSTLPATRDAEKRTYPYSTTLDKFSVVKSITIPHQNSAIENEVTTDTNTPETKNSIDSEGFRTVVTRKSKRKVIRGQLQSDNNILKAAPRKSYVYVGNLHPNTNENDLTVFLKSQFSTSDLTVEQLPKRPSAKSVSFKVTVDHNIFSDFFTEDKWPKGIVVKKFYFLKKEETKAPQNIRAPVEENP